MKNMHRDYGTFTNNRNQHHDLNTIPSNIETKVEEYNIVRHQDLESVGYKVNKHAAGNEQRHIKESSAKSKSSNNELKSALRNFSQASTLATVSLVCNMLPSTVVNTKTLEGLGKPSEGLGKPNAATSLLAKK